VVQRGALVGVHHLGEGVVGDAEIGAQLGHAVADDALVDARGDGVPEGVEALTGGGVGGEERLIGEGGVGLHGLPPGGEVGVEVGEGRPRCVRRRGCVGRDHQLTYSSVPRDTTT